MAVHSVVDLHGCRLYCGDLPSAINHVICVHCIKKCVEMSKSLEYCQDLSKFLTTGKLKFSLFIIYSPPPLPLHTRPPHYNLNALSLVLNFRPRERRSVQNWNGEVRVHHERWRTIQIAKCYTTFFLVDILMMLDMRYGVTRADFDATIILLGCSICMHHAVRNEATVFL